MRKTLSIALVLLLGLVTVNPASDGTWTRKADMPTARGALATAVLDGKIYAIGGSDAVAVRFILNILQHFTGLCINRLLWRVC